MNKYSKREDSSPIPGAAYIRYSSEMQSDGFSLDAQLRQIKEQAEREGVEIVNVFSDPAQSAYRKKFRPGINAMREAAKQGEFKILYVHKVDRLARRLEWSLEIVHELQDLDINFKAVQQPFDLSTPEGKLLFHLVSSLGEFYSDNVSKETNKGKYESSLQGYHNGHVPWGYTSEQKERRRVGVPDPEKAPVVVKIFELFATGLYSDNQIADWLNQRGFQTWRGRSFSKDTIRDLLQNPYYTGKVRYKGMSARGKGVSYRCTEGKLSDGQHEPIISEELWQQCQEVRAVRFQGKRNRQITRHIYLLNGIIVCAHCGRRLRAQTPKGEQGYYREVSHLNGFQDCPCSRTSVRSLVIDEQIALLVKSLRLPQNWDIAVRKMLQENKDDPDPEMQRKEIREQIRRLRTGYERGIYKDEEYVFWSEIESLQEKLKRLEKPQEGVINRAAETLLNLCESWEKATQDEQRDLVQMMLQEVGCAISEQKVIWVKPKYEFEVLFKMASGLKLGENGRFLLEELNGNKGQLGTQVNDFSERADNDLTQG